MPACRLRSCCQLVSDPFEITGRRGGPRVFVVRAASSCAATAQFSLSNARLEPQNSRLADLPVSPPPCGFGNATRPPTRTRRRHQVPLPRGFAERRHGSFCDWAAMRQPPGKRAAADFVLVAHALAYLPYAGTSRLLLSYSAALTAGSWSSAKPALTQARVPPVRL